MLEATSKTDMNETHCGRAERFEWGKRIREVEQARTARCLCAEESTMKSLAQLKPPG